MVLRLMLPYSYTYCFHVLAYIRVRLYPYLRQGLDFTTVLTTSLVQ